MNQLLYSIIQNTPGGTVALSSPLTMATAATYTLTAGTLNLANNYIFGGFFVSANSNTRSIAFGSSGYILVFGVGTTINLIGTNLTYTGTSNFQTSVSSATTTVTATNFTETNALSVYVGSGTNPITITTNSVFKS